MGLFERTRQVSCEAFPVQLQIDVTDICLCFFYLSSSVEKTALIFHENSEVFVNRTDATARVQLFYSSCFFY